MSRIYQGLSHVPKYSNIVLKAIQTPLIIYFALMGNLITFGAAAFFQHFESGINPQVTHYFDALWWSFATVSTVGYGDIVPMTTEGRIIGMILMVIGVLFIIGFTAILVAVVYGIASKEMKHIEQIGQVEYKTIMKRLDEIEKKLNQN